MILSRHLISGIFCLGYFPAVFLDISSFDPAVMVSEIWTAIYYLTGILSVSLSLVKVLHSFMKFLKRRRNVKGAKKK